MIAPWSVTCIDDFEDDPEERYNDLEEKDDEEGDEVEAWDEDEDLDAIIK